MCPEQIKLILFLFSDHCARVRGVGGAKGGVKFLLAKGEKLNGTFEQEGPSA